MSRVCELTGAKPMFGNKVSHANNKTKHRQLPNLKNKKYFIPELGRSITLKLSTRAIRSVEKMGGITAAILKSDNDAASLQIRSLKSQILK